MVKSVDTSISKTSNKKYKSSNLSTGIKIKVGIFTREFLFLSIITSFVLWFFGPTCALFTFSSLIFLAFLFIVEY